MKSHQQTQLKEPTNCFRNQILIEGIKYRKSTYKIFEKNLEQFRDKFIEIFRAVKFRYAEKLVNDI